MSLLVEKVRELFARFEKSKGLDDLRASISSTEKILDGNQENEKKIATNFLKANKEKQLSVAKAALKNEVNSDELEMLWKILNEFESSDFFDAGERLEINKIKNELLVKEFNSHIEKKDKEFLYFKKGSPPAKDFDSYFNSFLRKYEKIEND